MENLGSRASRQLSLRTTGTLRVLLGSIDGVGAPVREELVAVYGDVLRLSRTTVAHLMELDGIDHPTAVRVLAAAQGAALRS